MWRICSSCGYRGDEPACPDDGVELEPVRESTGFPGRLWPGQVLRDQYDISTLVGVGGMGAVYRGRHRITRQDVGIKVLWRDLASRAAEVRRFTREARAASILTHPNTVRVYDFGRDEQTDSIFMVMEYLVGQKLSDAQRTNPRFGPERAVHIVAQVCKSLEEAHSKGIVHRDLKPDNIFLQEVPGERDFVKVLDFGLAKFVSGDVERDSLTRTGYVVGSPEYMAPEQAIGSDVGPAVDLYACGIILFELLDGDLPFDAETTAQVLRKHIMEKPPAMRSDPKHPIPAALERVIQHCLSKDPADRPPTAEALRVLILQAHDRRRRPPSQPIEPLVLAAKPDKVAVGAMPFDTVLAVRPTLPEEEPPVRVSAPGAVAGEVRHPDGTFHRAAAGAQAAADDTPPTDSPHHHTDRALHKPPQATIRTPAAVTTTTREWPAWLLIASGALGAACAMAAWRWLFV